MSHAAKIGGETTLGGARRVIVVGAGPAGASTALALARAAVEVTLLDRSTYPRRKVCGSGLSPLSMRQLSELGILDRFEPLALKMAGITAKGPGGAEVRLRGKVGAWIVPRTEFDHGVVQEAVGAGASFLEGTRVLDMLRDDDGEVRGVATAGEELEADFVVCANGSLSPFEREQHPRLGIRTIMGWWKGADLAEPDMGTMIWDRRLEGYYAWSFPEPGDVLNVGITLPESAGESHHLRAVFQEILDEHYSAALANAEQIGTWKGHPVTVTTRVGDIAEHRALWVGEAARLVMPGTVEGIGFALQSGRMAARILAEHLDASHGLAKPFQLAYKSAVALAMVPKFLAGESFVRVMRSERARRLTTTVLDPQWAARRAAALLDDRPDPPGSY